MSLVVDSRDYLACLDCIVDSTKQTDATAIKLQNFAREKLIPACKCTPTSAQLREIQDYAKTYKILQEQFPVNSAARTRVAEAAGLVEKSKEDLFARHPVLKQLSRAWKNTEELWEMLTLANRSIKEDPALEQFLPPKLLGILNAVKRMRKTASEYLDKKIASLYGAYDLATKNTFSSLIKIYGYIDLKANKSEIISSIVKEYLGLHADPSQMEAQFSKSVATEVDPLVQTNLAAYDWLKENASSIVTPYNHGNENDPEGGACHQNCAARQQLLLKNPKMATKDLPLGSSEKTRSVRTQLKHGPRISPSMHVSEVESYAPFYAPFGMQFVSLQHMDGLEDLSKLLEKHSKPFLLRFQKGLVGHVINVQCDPKNQIFRFVCDGIGSVEYKSKDALTKGLKTYLEVFYPGWSGFLARFTSLLAK